MTRSPHDFRARVFVAVLIATFSMTRRETVSAQRHRTEGVVSFEPRDVPIRPSWARPEPPDPPVTATPTAREECGANRRCRIDRMRNRRHEQLGVRARAANRDYRVLEAARQRHDDWQHPRIIHPWLLDLVASDQQFALAAGYHPISFLALSLTVGYAFGVSNYTTLTRQIDPAMPELGNIDVYANAYINSGLMVGANVRVVPMDGVFSPYASLGFEVITLGGYQYSEYYGSDWGVAIPIELTSTDTSGTVEIHSLPVQVGIELQFSFGLRIRLGGVMRSTIYLRARDYDGPNQQAETGLHRAWHTFGAEGSVGWSL